MCHCRGMRFIVYGAGAVGGVVAASLAEHGEDVALIARGAHAAAIRDGGLVLESPAGRRAFPLPVATDPGELTLSGDDVVLLGVKSQDTLACLESLRPHVPPATPIVCLQNGVENERTALRYFENVYGVCVMLPATHLEPGVVLSSSAPVTGLLDIGRYPHGTDRTATRIAAALEHATFSSYVLADVMRWKYAKLLRNLGNALDALCGPAGRTSPLAEAARAEGIACLEAAGIPWASDAEDAARRDGLLRLRPVNGQRRDGSSTWQSLKRGTGAVETDYLNGEITLLGRRHGIPTPVNALLQRATQEAAAAHLEAGSLTPTDLESRRTDR
jgi:2-dehydropantoate 2-reductase